MGNQECRDFIGIRIRLLVVFPSLLYHPIQLVVLEAYGICILVVVLWIAVITPVVFFTAMFLGLSMTCSVNSPFYIVARSSSSIYPYYPHPLDRA